MHADTVQSEACRHPTGFGVWAFLAGFGFCFRQPLDGEVGGLCCRMMLLVMMAMRAIIESCDADVNCNTLESYLHTHTHTHISRSAACATMCLRGQSLRIHRFRTVFGSNVVLRTSLIPKLCETSPSLTCSMSKTCKRDPRLLHRSRKALNYHPPPTRQRSHPRQIPDFRPVP